MNRKRSSCIKSGGFTGALSAFLATLLFLILALSSVVHAGTRDEIAAARFGDPLDYYVLADKADRNGWVKLIVGLDVPFQPVGFLGPEAVATQRQRIAFVQKNLMNHIASFPVSDVFGYRDIPHIALTVDRQGLEALVESPLVAHIQEDIPVPAIQNWGITKIGAPAAWSQGYAGDGWAVAVLDTGVDKTHPFLSGAVVSEACYSTTDGAYSATSVCPGGVTSSTAAGSAMPYAGNCYPGDCDHGTHVAGIAAGRDNGSFSGVAPAGSIIAIQVFSRFNSSAYCGAGVSHCAMSFTSDQLKGLQRVYDLRGTYNIASVNMSLGGGRYYSQDTCDANNSATKAAIDNLRSVGIATVIASGNAGYGDSMGAPGCISSAVSVGATDSNDRVASFSNSAPFLSLLAPGVSINSSVPGGGYASWNGTSMATPHVAGAWAILKQAKPAATVSEVLSTLRSQGVSVYDAKSGVTTPRIQIDRALTSLTPGAAKVPTVTTSAITTITSTTATGGGNVTSDGGASVTARGICWGTAANPTTANSCTSNGTGTGSFTGSLTGLTPNTQYYVRAYAVNSVGTAYGSNISFTTLASTTTGITVTSPNGGEVWAPGTTQTITWDYAGSVGSFVKIELFKAGAFNRTITSRATTSSKSVSWAIPRTQAVGSDYQVKVTSTTNSTYTDMSDGNFTIGTGPVTPTITVTSPNGGESWQRGTTQSITWTYTGSAGSNVKIELLKGGTPNSTIIAGTPIGTGGTGSYQWNIPAGQAAGSDYTVRITSVESGTVTDTSDANFTITDTAPPPTSGITVTVPNGGESWRIGTRQTIRWTYTGNPGTSVKIELLKAGVVNATLTSSASIGSGGAGSYTWTIPIRQATGSDYRIRVTSTTDGTTTDTSDGNFSITR